MTIEEQLQGWGMDVKALKGEGVSLLTKSPRAFLTKETIYNKENSHETMFEV